MTKPPVKKPVSGQDQGKKNPNPKASPSAPHKGPPQELSGLSVNNSSDWDKIQQQWMKEKIEILQAKADKFFITDDDLPLRQHLLLMIIFLFFVAFVLWASFATLDEVTRGQGQVVPSSDIQVIQNLEGGIVDAFMAREGDQVKAGQVIMRLRDVGAQSDLGSNEARYLGLLATTTRLQAEIEAKPTVDFPEDVIKKAPQSVTEELNAFRANRAKVEGQLNVLEQQMSQRKQEISELQTRARDLGEVIRLSREEKSMIEPLVARGSAPKVELIQLERALREKQSELNGVKEALPRAESAVREAQARIDELTSTRRAEAQTELSAKMIEMNAIRETLGALTDRKERTEIRSPVNGTIKDLKINTVGGVVRAGDPIVEIVPRDDQLLVEAQVRPSDIAFIYPNQPATVKFTAYDYAIYGGLKAVVVDISPDAIKNEKGESFYRVKVRTEQNSLTRKGEILPIIPGMVTTVDILTGKKTIMEYLMKPIIKTVSGAMHER